MQINNEIIFFQKAHEKTQSPYTMLVLNKQIQGKRYQAKWLFIKTFKLVKNNNLGNLTQFPAKLLFCKNTIQTRITLTYPF